jgi:hypothetical protein
MIHLSAFKLVLLLDESHDLGIMWRKR